MRYGETDLAQYAGKSLSDSGKEDCTVVQQKFRDKGRKEGRKGMKG